MKRRTAPRRSSKKQVYLVDDHALVREGLVELIRSEPDLEVCGQAGGARRAMTALERVRPDVVIVDLSLPDGSGLDLIRQIKAVHPGLKVLVLSMHDELLYAERALKAGARGYVMKREDSSVFVRAIRAVLRGDVYASEAVKERLLQRSAGRSPGLDRVGMPHLSDREVEVFQMLGESQTTREIAERLGVSMSTVETHCAHLQQKLQVRGSAKLRQAAVAWATLR